MPSEPPSHLTDQLHDFVGFVRSRLHEELAAPGLHHSTRRTLQRRLARVGQIAAQDDGTEPTSLTGLAEGGVYLVNLAQRWREHPDYPGAHPARPAVAANRVEVVHDYVRGITGDLMHQVGGYPGLLEEARRILAEEYSCPDADLSIMPLAFGSDEDGFVRLRGEIRCTDARCLAQAAADRHQALEDLYRTAQQHLAAAGDLLHYPSLDVTPDADELTARWNTTEDDFRRQLRKLIDPLEPHAAPTTDPKAGS
ncbi:hypothetical protein ACI1MP_37515 (plasmid) [Kitasatospora griseola]|uniref:hypothetical protein n=1 Tax=Kitasatospora griseola TaxID=2064 RepID=UPI003855FD40